MTIHFTPEAFKILNDKIQTLEAQVELLTKCTTGNCGGYVDDYERFGKVQDCQGCINRKLLAKEKEDANQNRIKSKEDRTIKSRNI